MRADGSTAKRGRRPGGGQDRLYRLSSFELRGPFNVKGLSETPSRQRVFSCHPGANAAAAAEAKCARQIISTLARRAYRRPVTADDVNELFVYYTDHPLGTPLGRTDGVTGFSEDCSAPVDERSTTPRT